MEPPINRSLVAGCLLTAAGWLPVHTMPFLIAASISTQGFSIVESGLMASIFYFGQLSSTIVLPLISKSVPPKIILVLVTLMGSACLLTSSLAPLGGFYFLWFIYGTLNGVLLFFGSIILSTHENGPFAFTIRISSVSLLVGLSISIAYFLGLGSNYVHFVTLLIGIYIPVGIIAGLLLPLEINFVSRKKKNTNKYKGKDWIIGLLVFLVFVSGQFGFVSFAVEFGSRRGILFNEMTLSVACSKIFAAFVLFKLAMSYNKKNYLRKALIGSLILACSIISLDSSLSLTIFMLSFFIWEISTNMMSSLFQGALIELEPRKVSRFIIFFLLAGNGLGPLLSSTFVTFDIWEAFLAICIISSFLPFLWLYLNRKH